MAAFILPANSESYRGGCVEPAGGVPLFGSELVPEFAPERPPTVRWLTTFLFPA